MGPAKQGASAHRSPQIGRIARLLAVDADQVQGLDDIADEDLRALHDLISGMLSASGDEPFARVASLSKLLPGAVAGKLAERFLPPQLAARVAVLLEPAKARELVTKVSVDYLAELSLVLDPVRSRPVVQAIPADRVTQVARALFDRGEYAAMAEFAGTVTLEALFGALGVATARDLVEVVPLLVWNDNIDKVVADIPAAKIDQVMGEIVEHDLWDKAEYLVGRLRPDVIGTLAKGLFGRGQYAEMAQFVGIVKPEHLFAALDVASARDLLEVVPLLEWNDNIDQVVADIPAAKIDQVMGEIVEHDLWDKAEYLVGRLRPDVIGTLANGLFEREQYAEMSRFVGIVAPEHLFAALDVAGARHLLEVVPLLVWNDNIDQVVADIPAAKIDQVMGEIVEHDLWDKAEYLVGRLRPDVIGTLAKGLFGRGQYAEMAQFVGIVKPEHLFVALDVASARDLLEVVPLLEWNDNIDQVIAQVPGERIEQILEEVAAAEFWDQGNYLIEHLEGDARAHVVARAADVSDEVFTTLRRAADEGKLGAAAVALLGEAQRTRQT